MNIALILLMAHLVWCLAMWLVVTSGGLKADAMTLFLTLFIPFFGTVALLISDYLNTHGKRGVSEADIADMREREMPERTKLRAAPESRDVVPLEDALTLGSNSERREAMLDALMQDNAEGMPDFSQAQENADPEVVHYATTAMTELASDFETKLAQVKKAYDTHPDSADAMDTYVGTLERYFASTAAAGTMRRIHEREYLAVLTDRFNARHEITDARKIADLMLDTGDFDEANAVITMMEDKFPDEPYTLGERLRWDYETGRGRALHETIRAVRASGKFIPEDLAQVLDFWEGAGKTDET